MSVLDDTNCPARIQFRALGPQVAAAAQLYVRDAGGNCIPRGSAGSATYRLGAEVPPSTFLAAVEVDGETRGGFTEVLLQWEDGARQARGLRPDGQAQYGWPMPAADGAIRLLPSQTDADLLWWFSDSTCTAPAAESLASSCTAAGPTALAYFQDAATCEDRIQAFPVGGRLTQAYQFGGTCQPAIAPGIAFWQVGGELPAASFPTLSSQAVTDRISPQHFSAGTDWSWRGGWSLPQALDHDSGVAVRPLLAADGQERWLPFPTAASGSATQGTWSDWYFIDPACALRVHSVNVPATCTVTSPYIAITSADACGPTAYRIFALGPQVTGTIYRRTGPTGSCSALGSSGRYHQLGAEVPAASFAPVIRELR
jgi:hypothetical protein